MSLYYKPHINKHLINERPRPRLTNNLDADYLYLEPENWPLRGMFRFICDSFFVTTHCKQLKGASLTALTTNTQTNLVMLLIAILCDCLNSAAVVVNMFNL